MVNRRKRPKLGAADTLAGAWDRGEPPPDWAYQSGEHYEELLDIAFFGTETGKWMFARQHPYASDWWKAFKEAHP